MSNPNWLDESRRHSTVYTGKLHHACICIWDRHHQPDEPANAAMWVLRTRKARCVIHGRNGTH